MSLAVNTIPTPYIHVVVKRRKNTWYTVKDGNWTDPLVWESNAIRRWNYPGQNIPSPVFPQVGDDVYIGHTVTLNAGTSSIPVVVNNLYIAGTFKADNSSRQINVNGDIQATGSVDFTSSNVNLVLYGVNNYIVSFTSGTTSTITYARIGDQFIMDLSYRNLTFSGGATKYATNDLNIAGNLNSSRTTVMILVFELGIYNLSVSGNTSFVNSNFSKTGSGSILFIGSYSHNGGVLSLTGNPTVECRGGIPVAIMNGWNTGTNTWSFTTSSQEILTTANVILKFTGAVIVVGAITVTNRASITGAMEIDVSLDGTVAGSSFVNRGKLYLNTTSAPMATNGTFDKDTWTTNVVGYVYSGTFTIPYTTYQGLYISGTGIKTLGADTTVAQTFSGDGNYGAWQLELSSFAFSISGASTLANGKITKNSSTGLLLFIGNISTNSFIFDFSVGNGNIEFRGGISLLSPAVFVTGTGTWSFTTNNQTISLLGTYSAWNCSILISGAITLTFSGTGNITLIGTINGDNAASIIDNRAIIHYKNATAPMVTGLLYCNQATNTWYYDLAGNQDIQVPSDPTSPGYKNLTLAGSGAKRLLGNVSVKGTYTLTSPATLDLNGFALTNP